MFPEINSALSEGGEDNVNVLCKMSRQERRKERSSCNYEEWKESN
jgi:hypothetical protein